MAEAKSNEREQQRSGARQTGQMTAQQPRGGSLQRRQSYPSLLALSPFELMRRMSEDMLGIFGGPQARTGREQGIWAPRIEAFQKGDEFVVRAELPGMNVDDVIVEVGE